MNRDLVEWECGFVDCWDGQGHYTKDTEPAPYVWGLALDLADAVVASGEAFTLDFNDEDSIDDVLVYGVVMTALVIYTDACGIAIDNIFDDANEELAFLECITDFAYSAKQHGLSTSAIHERLVDSLSDWF